jgi:hypothetical protein
MRTAELSRLAIGGLVLLLVLTEHSTAQQSSGASRPDTVAADSLTPRPQPRRQAPPRPLLSFETAVSSVFDSNIEHDTSSIDSYGVVVGGTVGFRSRSRRPQLQLSYAAALHSYAQVDRWDRLSHIGRAVLVMPVGRRMQVGLTIEGSLKGSSEDRELGDQIVLLPQVEFRPGGDIRVRVSGARRWRYFDNSKSSNEYVGVESRTPLGPGTLDLSARFERNVPERRAYRFERQTYRTRYTAPIGERNELLAGVKYSPVYHPERLVEVGEDLEEPRRDRKWTPELIWIRDWNHYISTELEYEFEIRSSNNPEKKYRGHVVTLTAFFRR